MIYSVLIKEETEIKEYRFTGNELIDCLKRARKNGFTIISAVLIYQTPKQ
jgi:coproporphyrinogen III oxidase-like Fe-S oxidoreductase